MPYQGAKLIATNKQKRLTIPAINFRVIFRGQRIQSAHPKPIERATKSGREESIGTAAKGTQDNACINIQNTCVTPIANVSNTKQRGSSGKATNAIRPTMHIMLTNTDATQLASGAIIENIAKEAILSGKVKTSDANVIAIGSIRNV